ncbi:YfhD family protein [Paenibacillus sp. FSL H8-0034]|uniref:YfhD family protein n=1 Tax=Paenibacillus sp. FSL H8-0034 TaxID=2954671 RepID=UPI0030F8D319
MENKQKSVKTSRNQLPIAKKEDVDYNAEFADENDRIASERASEADQRQES